MHLKRVKYQHPLVETCRDPDRCVCFTEGGERHKERQKEREEAGPPKPRPLHLTTSLFMRSIAPDVCREELGAVRATHPSAVLHIDT